MTRDVPYVADHSRKRLLLLVQYLDVTLWLLLINAHFLIDSLFNMETTSFLYTDEDDLRSWFYSKHLVELERQEHIKRLREQGIIIPEEELVEEKGLKHVLV